MIKETVGKAGWLSVVDAGGWGDGGGGQPEAAEDLLGA